MNIFPLYDRVLIKVINQETTTSSGIVLPETATEKPDQGKVVSVGNGRLLDNGEIKPLLVNVNDEVLFSKYSGQSVKIDGDEFLVMKEEDIYAIIKK